MCAAIGVIVSLCDYVSYCRVCVVLLSCDTRSLRKTVVLEPAAVRVAVLVSESASLVKSELERVSWAVVVAIFVFC